MTATKRIMRKFRINELSAVNRPAQAPARALIMKRLDPIEKLGDLVDMFTGITDGHQHSIAIHEEEEGLYLRVAYSQGTGSDNSHDHQIARGLDGNYVVSLNAGHTHELDMDVMRNAIFNQMTYKSVDLPDPLNEVRIALSKNNVAMQDGSWPIRNEYDLGLVLGAAASHVKSNEVQVHVMKRALDLGLTDSFDIYEKNWLALDKSTAAAGGSHSTGNTEMTTKTAAEIAVETELAKVKSDLAIAKSFGEFTDVEKTHYSGLSDTDKELFIAKSFDDRAAEITQLEMENKVVYKSLDGSEYRKSDDVRLVAMAKQADADRTLLLKSESDREELVLRKRVTEDFTYLPGTIETRVAILKAMDSIADATVKTAAFDVLKAQNAKLASAFIEVGHSVVSKADAGSANAELEALAKAMSAKDGIGYYDAYAKCAEIHPDLYNKAVAG